MPSCCGQIGGWNPLTPAEPGAWCYDEQQNQIWRTIVANAKILLDRHGINPCLIPGTGRISRGMVEAYLRSL